MNLLPMTPEHQPLKSNPEEAPDHVTMAIYSEPSTPKPGLPPPSQGPPPPSRGALISKPGAPHLQGGGPHLQAGGPHLQAGDPHLQAGGAFTSKPQAGGPSPPS